VLHLLVELIESNRNQIEVGPPGGPTSKKGHPSWTRGPRGGGDGGGQAVAIWIGASLLALLSGNIQAA
jgi:hypothetical protein